jgi:hydroxyacylglutathione hydrolase
MCYYAVDKDKSGVVFTGDTLFYGGCGRIFECYPETMLGSLQKLMVLSDETIVYPGHDYTREDYEFALSILGKDQDIEEALRKYISEGKGYTSTIGWEKKTNIFLRAQSDEEFAELRRKKDLF